MTDLILVIDATADDTVAKGFVELPALAEGKREHVVRAPETRSRILLDNVRDHGLVAAEVVCVLWFVACRGARCRAWTLCDSLGRLRAPFQIGGQRLCL